MVPVFRDYHLCPFLNPRRLIVLLSHRPDIERMEYQILVLPVGVSCCARGYSVSGEELVFVSSDELVQG